MAFQTHRVPASKRQRCRTARARRPTTPTPPYPTPQPQPQGTGPSAARRVQGQETQTPTPRGPGHPAPRCSARILILSTTPSSSPVDPFPHASRAALPAPYGHTVASLASPPQLTTAQQPQAHAGDEKLPSHQQRRARDRASEPLPSLSLSSPPDLACAVAAAAPDGGGRGVS
jgi:hypothetical protein